MMHRAEHEIRRAFSLGFPDTLRVLICDGRAQGSEQRISTRQALSVLVIKPVALALMRLDMTVWAWVGMWWVSRRLTQVFSTGV